MPLSLPHEYVTVICRYGVGRNQSSPRCARRCVATAPLMNATSIAMICVCNAHRCSRAVLLPARQRHRYQHPPLGCTSAAGTSRPPTPHANVAFATTYRSCSSAVGASTQHVTSEVRGDVQEVVSLRAASLLCNAVCCTGSARAHRQLDPPYEMYRRALLLA